MNWRATFGWGAAAIALAMVFVSYLLPGMAMTLAVQLWNCF